MWPSGKPSGISPVTDVLYLINDVFATVNADSERLLTEMAKIRPEVEILRNVPIQPEIQKYRFDIWDFGGQLVYYTAHQTFLSQRAIYLLVVDMTKELDKPLPTSEENEAFARTPTRWTYWQYFFHEQNHRENFKMGINTDKHFSWSQTGVA